MINCRTALEAPPHTVGADTEDVLTTAGFAADELTRLGEQRVI